MTNKLRGQFVAGLRQLHQRYWPPKRAILVLYRYKKEGYRGYLWDCQICGKVMDSKEVKVDHIVPVGVQPELEAGQIGPYADRMFTSIENYQLICHDCHKAKTAEDMQQIRQQRKEINFAISQKELAAVNAMKKPTKKRRKKK